MCMHATIHPHITNNSHKKYPRRWARRVPTRPPQRTSAASSNTKWSDMTVRPTASQAKPSQCKQHGCVPCQNPLVVRLCQSCPASLPRARSQYSHTMCLLICMQRYVVCVCFRQETKAYKGVLTPWGCHMRNIVTCSTLSHAQHCHMLNIVTCSTSIDGTHVSVHHICSPH